MKLHIIGTAVTVLLVGQTVSAGAQSLADLAREEQARRKAVPTPARVYTDADAEKHQPLTTAAARPAAPEQPGTAASATESTATGAATPAAGDKTDPAERKPEGEAAWRARIEEARDGLARNRRLLDALEQQAMRAAVAAAAAVAAGQSATADPEGPARMQEMQRLRNEMDKFTATLATIEEEARRAGVPPGWVR